MAPAAAPVRRVSALHPLATKGQRIVGQMAPEAAEAVDPKVRILVNGHTIANGRTFATGGGALADTAWHGHMVTTAETTA